MTIVLNGTSGITDVNGTAAAPAITGTDTDTGIFFPAANTLGFSTNGAEVARFDSSGNLGLGVTPSAWGSSFKALQMSYATMMSSSAGGYYGANFYYNSSGNPTYVNNGYALAYSAYSAGGAHLWLTAPSGTAGNAITFTQAMTLDSAGALGIGYTTPSVLAALAVKDAGYNGTLALLSSTASNSIYIKNTGTSADFKYNDAYPMTWSINGTERMRLDSSGNLLVGQQTKSQTTVGTSLTSDGIVSTAMAASTGAANCYHLYSTGAAAYRFYVSLAGTINATSTTITGISDQRLKENIRDLDDGLEKVMALKPRKFDWKEGKGAGTKDARGFIAQEFETVFPDMIEEWLDPAPEGEEPYKAVNANLIPTLVKAIQELKAIVDAQAAEIAALKGQA